MATHVVVGGQFGSEGKGAFTAGLVRKIKGEGPVAAIRVGGPNAGHSVVDPTGRVWKLRQVPVAAVVDPDAMLIIAPGSEVDKHVLHDEITELDYAGFNVTDRLFIDRTATLIEPSDAEREHAGGLIDLIGSTGKGIGLARSRRIMRSAELVGDQGVDTTEAMGDFQPANIVIEGTQGYGLGLHAGYYPYCTSRDCRAIDFLAEAGLNPWGQKVRVWVVYRTFPIRVAGNSGPLAFETSWEELADKYGSHIKEERTTVTNKVRRVGVWDHSLARAAMVANGGPSHHVRAAVMFADYLIPELYNAEAMPGYDKDPDTLVKLQKFMYVWSDAVGPAWAIGTGPDTLIWRIEPE